jgi:hypothetical protein
MANGQWEMGKNLNNLPIADFPFPLRPAFFSGLLGPSEARCRELIAALDVADDAGHLQP